MKKDRSIFILSALVIVLLLGILTVGAFQLRQRGLQGSPRLNTPASQTPLPLPEGEIDYLILEAPARGSAGKTPRCMDQRTVTDPAEIQKFLNILQGGLKLYYPHRAEYIGDEQPVYEHSARVALFSGGEGLAMELNGCRYLYIATHAGSWEFSDEGAEALRAFLAAHPQRELSDPAEYAAIELHDPNTGAAFELQGEDFAAAVSAIAAANSLGVKMWGGTLGAPAAELRVTFTDGGEMSLAYEKLEKGAAILITSQTVQHAWNASGGVYDYFALTAANDAFAALFEQYLGEEK